MKDIISWSRANAIDCSLQFVTNSGNLPANSYFLLSKPTSNPRPQLQPALIILHGTGNDAWFPQVNIISRGLNAGLKVAALNLPGHGRHDDSQLDCDGLEHFLDLVVRDVIEKSKAASIFLWGQSIGAATIAKFLTTHSEAAARVRGAVLVALPQTPHVNVVNVSSELLLPLLPTYWDIRRTYGIYGSIPPFGWFKRQTFPVRMHRRYGDLSYISVIAKWFKDQDWPNIVAKLSKPTLLIYGTLDHVASVGDAVTLQKRIPKCRLEVLPWETHFTIAASRRTADLSINFVKEHW